jgi:hypothetical protein
MFGYPTEVITDLIGARVICWFVDDCYGMLDYIQATTQFRIQPRSLEDYIIDPKRTGWSGLDKRRIRAGLKYREPACRPAASTPVNCRSTWKVHMGFVSFARKTHFLFGKCQKIH